MTQEDKELLLRDLCARLPYGVIIQEYNEEYVYADNALNTIGIGDFSIHEACIEGTWINHIENVKPYLRPLSSMTEEESKEFESLWNSGFEKALDAQISNCDDNVVRNLEIIASSNAIDFLNKKMFAYRTIDGKDMFELGIAIKAPEGMYNIKEQ